MPESILDRLPVSLQYLKDPALKYGVYQFVSDIDGFLGTATSEEMAELTSVGDRVHSEKHYPMILEFIKEYPITEHPDSACLYFLFGVLDYAGIKFD